jgi:hypothetical protein
LSIGATNVNEVQGNNAMVNGLAVYGISCKVGMQLV